MGRVRSEIEMNGRKYWTLFDSGARNSYIVREAIDGLAVKDLPTDRRTALGGKEHQIRRVCVVIGKIEGRWVEFLAGVVDEIGHDEDGRSIEILFGALAMQEWGIRLDLPNERLDLSRYSREFVEF